MVVPPLGFKHMSYMPRLLQGTHSAVHQTIPGKCVTSRLLAKSCAYKRDRCTALYAVSHFSRSAKSSVRVMATTDLEARVGDLTLEPQDKTILLIGSTGNGKSTLGNCLLDPSQSPKEVFIRGRSSVPLTQNVQMENGLLRLGTGKRIPLQIIDTPGLNESAVKDLTHMIEIVETVRKAKEITACLLCVKFNTQIDVQYRATVRYYRSLLPKLFEANVIVVFTDYSENPYEVKKREREGIDPDDVIKNATAAIMEAADLPYTPTYFCIDSLPLADEDMKFTMEARGAILGYVGTLSGVDTSYLLVAKTPALQVIDRERVKELDGQITGYNEKIKQIKTEAGIVLDTVEATSKKCTRLKAERLDVEATLTTTDTDELLPVKQWSIEEKWKFLKTQSRHYDVSSPCRVDKFKYWDNGHLNWSEKKEEEASVSGVVKGKFMRGLYGSITLLAESRVKNADRIQALKRRIRDIEDTLDDAERTTNVLRKQNEKYEEDIASLKEYIDSFEAEKAERLRQRLSLDLAYKRLSELPKAKDH